MSSDWIKGLNPEQSKAVLHNEGPLLILAGAGSGKTTVLVARTGRLISEQIADPKQICVLTFTNKAAKELKHRVGQRVGKSAAKIWAGTFHSYGLHLLRKYHKQARLAKNFGVVDASDCQSIVKELAKDTKILGREKFDTEKLLNLVNDFRCNGPKLSGPMDEYDEMAEVITPKFVKKLELLGVVDFEGLLLKPLQIMKEHPEVLEDVQSSFTQMMVDEFQDTNLVQMDLINQIVVKHQNIAVVGDDDQSIYGWRGACVSNILDFPKNYKGCEVIRLERNYRSTPAILELANESIKKNSKRHGKILRSEAAKEHGEKPELFVLESEEAEADFVVDQIRYFKEQGFANKEIAVLYRSNSQGGLVESFLRRSSIPYAVSGGSSFFDRKEIRDILAYLRCSIGAHDVAFRRIINTPARGIGDNTVEKIIEWSEEHKISFVRAAKHWREISKANNASLPVIEPSTQTSLFADEPADQAQGISAISPKAGEAIDELFAFLDRLSEALVKAPVGTVGEVLLKILTDMGYRQLVYASATALEAGDKKWQLVEIFARVLDSFFTRGGGSLTTLKEFVDSMELRDDSLGKEEEKDEVQLLTLHACKGLEFPVCLMIGLEEDIIPHRTLGMDIDEERRLFYVGITRAQKRLVLSRCQQRKRHGSLRPATPSRFLVEVPNQLYIEFPAGNRPVTENEKDTLVSNFLASLADKPSIKI